MADGSLKFDTKIDTDGFKQGTNTLKGMLNRTISTLKKTGSSLVNAFANTGAIDGANARVKALVDEIDQYRDSLYYLEKQGLYFGDAEYDSAYQKLSRLENELNSYKKELSSVDGGQKKATSSAKRFGNELKKTTKASIPLTKSIFKLSNMFKLLVLRMVMRAVIRSVQEGFQNLAQYSNQANKDMSILKTSLQTLQNSFATAFAPILTAITPALQSLINHLSQAITVMGQFFAVLFTGATTFTKAKDAQVNYAKSLKNTAKEANKSLSPIDKLNNISDSESSESGGGYEAPSPQQMFEEVQIDSKFIDMVDSIKASLSELFNPIKQSWSTYGEPAINSAKTALGNVKSLLGEIGNSLKTVWLNGTGTETIDNILMIFTNINDTISAIAENFKIAWVTDGTGTQILQNIWDIINNILGAINEMSQATAEWASGLDFTPILTSFENLTGSLEPLTGTIADGLVWFYENVLLPLAGWVITDVIPLFFDGLAAVLDILNNTLTALEPLGIWLWENFLQPLATWTGNAIIAGLGMLTEGLNNLSNWILNNQELFVTGALIVGAFFLAFKVPALIAALTPLLSLLSGLGSVLGAIISPAGLIVGLIGLMVYAFVDLYRNSESFRESIAELGRTWMTALKPLAEFVGQVLADAWDKILKPIINFFIETLLPNLINIFKNLWENVLVPLGDFIGTYLAPVFEILADLLTMLWKKVVLPLAEAVGEVLVKAWDAIYAILSKTIIPIIKKAIEVLKFLWEKVINPIIKVLWDNLKPAFDTVFTGIGKILKDLLKALGGVIDFIAGVFTGDWSKAWQGIQDIFKGIFDALVGIVKTPINLIIDIINGLIGGIVSGVNTAIKAINSISFTVPDWVPGVGGKSIGFSLKTITAPKVPKLATGTVVPANYGEFLAVLGDNKREAEVVSPVSKIEEAVENVLNRRGGQGGGDIHIWLEGDAKGIFKVVRVAEGEYYDQTGKAAFVH